MVSYKEWKDDRRLEKTGYEVFRVPHDVTQEEQEEVWIPANIFMEVYEKNDGEFEDCAYWPKSMWPEENKE